MTQYHVTVIGEDGTKWEAAVGAAENDVREALIAALEVAERQQDTQERA